MAFWRAGPLIRQRSGVACYVLLMLMALLGSGAAWAFGRTLRHTLGNWQRGSTSNEHVRDEDALGVLYLRPPKPGRGGGGPADLRDRGSCCANLMSIVCHRTQGTRERARLGPRSVPASE